jgi:hypothetical protein
MINYPTLTIVAYIVYDEKFTSYRTKGEENRIYFRGHENLDEMRNPKRRERGGVNVSSRDIEPVL